jgi:hypothetical protein
MTKRVDRLMTIGVLGYIVVSFTQVLLAGPASRPAPEWVAGFTQLMGGG